MIQEWEKSPATNENLTRTQIRNKMLWTREQLIFVTTSYFTHGKSIVKAQRSFEMMYRFEDVSIKKVITRYVKNFSESGNLDKKKSKGRLVTATDENNAATAKQIIEGNRQISLNLLSQQLDISSKSAHTILKKKLSMHPYKMQICQKLHEGDFERRVAFCEWFLQKYADNSNFNQTLILSDEAHFELNGCVNKQNIRFWEILQKFRFIQKESQCGVESMSIGLSVRISLKMGLDQKLQ